MSINNAGWFLLVGLLLILIGLSRPAIAKLPVTSAMIYLSVGMAVGPAGLALFHFNPLKESALLEILTEVAVLISLFAAGVKMPVPFSGERWRAPLQLAFIAMAISVAAVTVFSYYFLSLPLGAAVLLGAIVAPTDPVLATDVQSRHPGDEDILRFSLTSEAGINDGSAFPFVMLGLGLLGLHDLGTMGLNWVLVDLLWATLGAIALGILAGYGLARIGYYCRQNLNYADGLLDDFLGLGLIASVYGMSLLLNTWGFLAVFASAVALRQGELKLAGNNRETCALQDEHLGRLPEAENHVCENHVRENHVRENTVSKNHVSEASLIFKEHLERLSELVLILLVGGMLFADSWSWEAVIFSVFLFFVARPLSALLGLLGTNTPFRVRCLIGYFGVRGIGSLYYLMYAIVHGLPEEISLQLTHITLVVIVLSIFLHGFSVKPIINRAYNARRRETGN